MIAAVGNGREEAQKAQREVIFPPLLRLFRLFAASSATGSSRGELFGSRPSGLFRNSGLGIRVFSVASALLGHLDQLNLVSLRGIDEGNAASVCAEMRPVGIFDAEVGEVAGELLEAIHFESEVG